MPPSTLPKALKAKPASVPEKDTALALFHANLNAMREWYRQQPNAGHTCGINVAMELAVSDTLTALGNALEGKTWEPPSS